MTSPSQVVRTTYGSLQFAGTLEEASASNVVLTGAAQAKNVFWATAGAVSIGTQAHFEGTILSKSMVAMNSGLLHFRLT